MNQKILLDNFTHSDDGFAVTTAEPWVKHKVKLIQQYLTAFTTAVSSQVDEIVFVDLFARNGLYCLGARKEIFAGTPIMALQQELPISKYVFCEQDLEQLRILKVRVNKYYRNKNIALLDGRPETLQDKLKMYVPEWRKDHKVAVFCVCDPFALEPAFDVIRNLSEYGFTFLIPLTFHMGSKIDYRFYMHKEADKIKGYLEADKDLRNWEKGIDNNLVFYKRLVRQMECKLAAIGLNGSVSSHKLDSGLMEIPTYSISLFSKRYSAKAIHMDALAESSVQFALFNTN